MPLTSPDASSEPFLALRLAPRIGRRTPPHTDSCRGRDLGPQATWPPSSTGASQHSPLPTQVRCPGSPAFPQRCMPIPSGGTTWQSDPNWSPTSPTRSKTTPANVTPSRSGHHGNHPGTALVGEIAVWRAANGINPQDPRPTGGAQLETLPALWKQRLDRDIARAAYPPAVRGPTNDRQHTPHLVAGTTTASVGTKHPVNVRTGQPHPAANHRRAAAQGLWFARHSLGTQPWQPTAESGAIRVKGRVCPAAAPTVFPSPRAGFAAARQTLPAVHHPGLLRAAPIHRPCRILDVVRSMPEG